MKARSAVATGQIPVTLAKWSADDLLDMVREGQREALRVLAEQYWSRLMMYAECHGAGRDAVSQVVESTFVHVWRQRTRRRRALTPSSYLYRITRQLARGGEVQMDQPNGTRAARERLKGPAGSRFQRPTPPAATARVAATFSALSEQRLEIFTLCRDHQLTEAEIGEVMELPVELVRVELLGALAELRAALSRTAESTREWPPSSSEVILAVF